MAGGWEKNRGHWWRKENTGEGIIVVMLYE